MKNFKGRNNLLISSKLPAMSCCIFDPLLYLSSINRQRKVWLYVKASLTFKCMKEHLFADFSYSIALDTYL